LKKRTKKLLLMGFAAVKTNLQMDKSFLLLFFKKEDAFFC